MCGLEGLHLREILQGSGQESIDVAFSHGGQPTESDPGEGWVGDPAFHEGCHIRAEERRIFVGR